MFQKLVVIEPLHLLEETEQAFDRYARQVVRYQNIPGSDDEIVRRLEGADAVLINVTTSIGASVIARCPSLRYIGMCCSLYEDESCSVDLKAARAGNILVTGVSDYGDEGVPEFVTAELIMLLHGFHAPSWGNEPLELTGFPIGIIGAGATGSKVARALRFFGADLAYYSRTPKSEWDEAGIPWMPLHDLLCRSQAVCTCLNKFTVLLHEKEFETWGNHKILINTGLSPSYDLPAVRKWLDQGNNYLFCDSSMALGDENLRQFPNVTCPDLFAGMSRQSVIRLSRKVLQNIDYALKTLQME